MNEMNIKVEVKFNGNDGFSVRPGNSGTEFYVNKGDNVQASVSCNPLELFISSLGACIGVYSKRYLSNHSIEFNNITIKVSARLSDDSPKRLMDIKADISTDAIVDREEVFLRFINGCPIHNTIVHTKDVNISLSCSKKEGNDECKY